MVHNIHFLYQMGIGGVDCFLNMHGIIRNKSIKYITLFHKALRE